MKFTLNKKDKTIKADTRIEVPQEFKVLYRALEYIERNDWLNYDSSISELLYEVTKYNEYGLSMFDELFRLNKKYKLDDED